jgi:hypothetical protein
MVTVQRLISPQTWLTRQMNGVNATAQTNYSAGIDTPKKDPIVAAVASKQKWANQVQAAITNDLFAKGLGNTSMAEWNAAAKTLGVNRLVPGIQAKQAKISNFITSFSPLLSNLLQTVDAMPVGTASERDAKAQAMIQGLRALRGTWK